MKTYIIATIIIGAVFYTLCGSLSKSLNKSVEKQNETVNMYVNLLEK